MFFFHKRWWLKKKKFPNCRTVLASAWSDRCGVASRRFWPAVYWKKPDPIFFFGRESFIHVNVHCLPSRKKRETYRSTVAPENEEHLGPENWFLLRPRIGTMISLAFSIFLDMKISGVTLFGGMADWRNDGTEWWNTWNILKYGIYGIL